MTLTKKLGLALVFGGAMGAATHWLVGAVAFAAAACVVTLGQIRHEVRDLRSLVDEEEAAMSIPPSSLPSHMPSHMGSHEAEHEHHAAAT
jgi:hypothetical protein